MSLIEIILNKFVNIFLRLFGHERKTPGVRDWLIGWYHQLRDAEVERARLRLLGNFPIRLFDTLNYSLKVASGGVFWLEEGRARVFEHCYQIGVGFNGVVKPEKIGGLESALEDRLTAAGMDYDVKFAQRPLRIIVDKKKVPVQRLSEHLDRIGNRDSNVPFLALPGIAWKATGQKVYYSQEIDNTCGFSTIIFGSSGSGKSQLAAAYLATLLYRNSPDDLAVVIVDPKLEDFLPFNSLPHLACPVIGEVDEAIDALGKVVTEMDRRVTDKTNNRRRILFFCDEIADLVMQDESVANDLRRICQKGRSLGIGTMLANQRAVKVPGLADILTNISVRCVGRLPSEQESRFAAGHEGVNTSRSRGNGDFLIFSAKHHGLQIQGFWFDKPDVITDMIAKRWDGATAHWKIDQGKGQVFENAAPKSSIKPELLAELNRLYEAGGYGAVTGLSIRNMHSNLYGVGINGTIAGRIRSEFLDMAATKIAM